jgi:hypothetical protein
MAYNHVGETQMDPSQGVNEEEGTRMAFRAEAVADHRVVILADADMVAPEGANHTMQMIAARALATREKRLKQRKKKQEQKRVEAINMNGQATPTRQIAAVIRKAFARDGVPKLTARPPPEEPEEDEKKLPKNGIIYGVDLSNSTSEEESDESMEKTPKEVNPWSNMGPGPDGNVEEAPSVYLQGMKGNPKQDQRGSGSQWKRNSSSEDEENWEVVSDIVRPRPGSRDLAQKKGEWQNWAGQPEAKRENGHTNGKTGKGIQANPSKRVDTQWSCWHGTTRRRKRKTPTMVGKNGGRMRR